MTPLRFEAEHAAEWDELEAAVDAAAARRRKRERKAAAAAKKAGDAGAAAPPSDVAADRFATLYRAACEHLAIARARAYPVALVERLESLTGRAHQRIYAERRGGLAGLAELFGREVPRAVRRHRLALAVACVAFVLPLVFSGVAAFRDPGFVLRLHDIGQVQQYDHMYGDGAEAIGRREAEGDWSMFGLYIRNNIGIAFQCFAAGIVWGVGSLFFLVYNGLAAGSVAGYLTWRGHGENFWSFVVTHGAFELPAIVLAGCAGLLLGGALLAPGRRSRGVALRDAAAEAIVIVYGVVAMLVAAAALEAFWSSQRWIDAPSKYASGALAWAMVLAWLGFGGRAASDAKP